MRSLAELEALVRVALDTAQTRGASAAAVRAQVRSGLDVSVRLGELETVEHHAGNAFGVTVFYGHCKGAAGSNALSAQAVRETVEAACTIAQHTAQDPYAGLPEPEHMAIEVPELDLYHPWSLDTDTAIEIATRCETAARGEDERITNSEGAQVSSRESLRAYGNSHGFLGSYRTTDHSVHCAVIGGTGEAMQREHWYTRARSPIELQAPEEVGREAARRTVRRLGARQLPTRTAPVLFAAQIAPTLLGHFIGAIQGGALYRRASFLVDHLGRRIFPAGIRIHEQPLLPQGLGSAPFDGEGVAPQTRDIVADGVLQGYVLDSYAARKLGMTTTGNAGGVRNLTLDPGADDWSALLRRMDTGVLVTQVMGQGVNLVTGDYSRGASGFWVERGEVRYPVEQITIAAKLPDMFRGLVAVGRDLELRGNVRTGSLLIEAMTIAGA